MSALSAYLENALLNHLLRNTAYSKPGTLHVALFTANPGDSGVSGEVSGGSYARAAVTNNGSNFPPCPVSGTPVKSNATAITFPQASAAWGTITHWAIYDAASGGTNMLASGPLASPRAIASGDRPRIGIGGISLTMPNATSGGLSDFAKRALLDHVFGSLTYTPAATIYTGLGNGLVGQSLSEWVDSSYSRQVTAFNAASGGACVNTDAETYSADVAGGPDTLTHFAVWDDGSAGNLLAVGPLATSRAVVNTDTVTLSAGAFSIALQ